MPVMSYLAYAASADRAALADALAQVPGCEVLPSDRNEVLVVVTDTPDEQAEQALQARLQGLSGLKALVLVAAFADEA